MSYNPYSFQGEATANDRFRHGSQPSMEQGQPLFGAQQASQQQMPPQQQQQQQQPGFNFQNPTQSMAFQLGQSAFSNFIGEQNFSQFQETVSKATSANGSLSLYFQVTTNYVINKLRVILIPFTNKNWQRIPEAQQGSNGALSFMPPKDDINSPDMYIPIMGLVTYILIWNTQQGLKGSFNPENLYYKLSSTVAFVLLDLVILKLGLYLLVSTSSRTTNIVELICFVGYKFVPLILALFLPSSPIYLKMIVQVYLFIAFGVFLLRSVKFNLFTNTNSDMVTFNKATVRKCNYFLFVYGFIWQSILMWLMG
ncbi:hypothetical protein J6895_03192 [Nakaseomyces glabratus]|nr:hypothetical protein J6895_03192 [Nakaseomyces glabratus]